MRPDLNHHVMEYLVGEFEKLGTSRACSFASIPSGESEFLRSASISLGLLVT